MMLAAGHFFSSRNRGLCGASHWYCFPLLIQIILISFSTSMPIKAQDLDDLLKTANEHYDKEQYHTAAQYYQVAVGPREDHPKTTYRLAQSYRAIFNYSLAAHYYERTMELDESTYPLSIFYLAQMQKSMSLFKKAKDGFEYFIQTNSAGSFLPKKERDNFIKQAEDGMESCSWAIEQLNKNWREMGFAILPEPVNSVSNDYAAVATGNSSVITITSGRRGVRGGMVDNRFGEYFTDNFRYKKQDNSWIPESTSDHFDRTNTKFSDGVGTYNATGDKYYFTSCYEGSAFCKLYVTRKENGVWKNPVLLNDHVNAPGYDNKHPTLTQGGDTLIFISNRPGGPGGNDLWFSISKDEEAWEAPKPIPGNINTPFNEASPYCHEGNVLFFSSDGHIGMGGMDIFMVESYQSPNSKIQNLGTPFNSGFDDSFFSLSADMGYLSSNRPNGYGKFDIYTFNLPTDDTNLADFLEESAERTQLRSRIRSNDGSNLYSVRDEDQFYYDNLTAEERARLDRILIMKQQAESEFDPKKLSREDFKYYKKLDITTKATIERLAHKRAMELEGIASGDPMTPQEKLDWEFYHNIDKTEKQIIDRIIDLRVEGRRRAMARLSPAEAQYTANPKNQERIDSKVQLRSLTSLAESLNDQKLAGIDKLNKNQSRQLVTSGDGIQVPLDLIYVENRSNEYLNSIEKLGMLQMIFYEELSPEDRDNLHKSAVRQFIVDHPRLSGNQKNSMLSELYLEDPMIIQSRLHSPVDIKKTLEIREVLVESLNAKTTSNQQVTLLDQILLELETQQFMLQQQLELISKKESSTRDLQGQLQKYIDGQEHASDLVLEEKIVQEFYTQSQRGLPLLSPKESYYFNTLSPGHQLRIDRLSRLVDMQTKDYLMATVLSRQYLTEQYATDQWYYQELNESDKEIVDQLVAKGWHPDSPYAGQQQKFITGLGVLERERIDRMMGNQEKLNFEVFEESRIAIDNKAFPQEEEVHSADIQHLEASVKDPVYTHPVDQVNYLGAQIYFDFDGVTLRSEAKKALDEMIEFLSKQGRPIKILIEGHTDNIGSITHNDQLGKHRSLSAAEFFQPSSSSIEITTKSYGEERPTSNNRTARGRQLNRRVELKIQGIPYQSPLGAYLVKPNVTLAVIVETTGLLEEDILKWNGLQNKELEAYQPLRLPVDLDYRSIKHLLHYPQKYSTKSKGGAYHTVQRGENLFRLALRYHTTVQELEYLNNIKATDLLAGQQLRIH